MLPMRKVMIKKPKIPTEMIFLVPNLPITKPTGICETAYLSKKRLDAAPA